MQVDGSVFVVYNVGLTDHTISDPYVKVNDGTYHVIRFMRSGANATLRIDDLPQQTKIPTGLERVLDCANRDFLGKFATFKGNKILPQRRISKGVGTGGTCSLF